MVKETYSKVLIREYGDDAIDKIAQEDFCVAVDDYSVVFRVDVPVELEEGIDQLLTETIKK